jgi:DNA-binding transcriptional LysR family regulator
MIPLLRLPGAAVKDFPNSHPAPMNIHHLELFYYVAKFGGISEAVRHMPYGIQQPAISGQVINLEEFLGVTLFQRRPFQLTEAGEELYAFIRPFFDNIDGMAEKIRGGGQFQHLRIGASEIVLRDHIPEPLQNVRKKFPKLKVTLRLGYQAQIEEWLARQEIDVGVTIIEARPPTGMQSQPLIQIQVALLVPQTSPLKSAEELWQRDKITETLIAMPANHAITRVFQSGLGRMGVDWLTGIEVGALELIQPYVLNGYGIGLTLAVPGAELSPKLRLLPLKEIESVTVGALWRGKLSAPTQAFLDEMNTRARKLAAQ